ncbi:LOB domain-containing protein 29-like [Wolffia australiana]
MKFPQPDRWEAAVTISYKAQARLQDPVYSCISRIFALKQQRCVANLQAQLASLMAQSAGSYASGFSMSFPSYQKQDQICMSSGNDMKVMRTLDYNRNDESGSCSQFYSGDVVENKYVNEADMRFHLADDDGFSCLDKHVNGRKSNVDDLPSAATTYLQPI